MFLNMRELPSDLQHRYTKLGQDYKQLQDDLREYQLSKVPRYVSAMQYVDEIGVQMDYDQYKELAEIARNLSIRYAKPIRQGSTEIGVLYCFLEEILDEAFEAMTLPDDEEF